MTTHPTPTASPTVRPFGSSTSASKSAPSWLGRWLPQPSAPAPAAGFTRDEVERMVQTRTAELESEIAGLRERIDRQAKAKEEAATLSPDGSTTARLRFLAAVAHDLRTPLNGIVGVADLLSQTPLTQEQRQLVRLISRSSETLLRSATDILDLAKMEAGRFTIEREEFDLAEELQLAVDLHADVAARKGLALMMEIDRALPTRVVGDPLRLRQIAVNLLTNAVKFTDQGEITLRAQLERRENGRVRIRFGVSDTGVGIGGEAQARLFEPFVQANADAARRGGTGLGLSICKQLVTLMGGEIGVSSAVNTGSTFWFSVELEDAPAVPEAAAPSPLAGRHILIVDDNATNRKLFCQLAASWNMHADMADSVLAAMNYLREAARAHVVVDFVLIDHHLNGADGLSLAKEIRETPSLSQPILTLLTSHARRLTPAEMAAHGITGCAAKPLHPRTLRTMLLNAMTR